MLTVENDKLAIRAAEDGSSVSVVDKPRRCEWVCGSLYRRYRGPARQPKERSWLPASRATRHGRAITITCPIDGGEMRYVWQIHDDHVSVAVHVDAENVEHVSLPGAFVPAEGGHEIAIPLFQGLLVGPSGRTWEITRGHGGHDSFSMAMGGVLGQSGALLVAHDSPSNWSAVVGEDQAGPYFYFEHRRCQVEGWVDAVVRLYCVESDVTALCKRYRQRLIERGRFVTWDQKIARKPIVKDLFGATMAFIGYNQATEVDYVGSARKMRAYGFDSVFYYPVRMCHYCLEFKMGGDDPIWLSDQTIEAIRAVEGAHVAPWAWVYEALDDGSSDRRAIFRHGKDGAIPGWKIDQFAWHLVCTPYQVEHMKQRFASDMKAMDWVHFDVCAQNPGTPCLNVAHDLHGRGPLGARQDGEWVGRLFDLQTVGNRIVSSEGFVDQYTPYYDIGSTKVMPSASRGSTCVPIPMTMLIFHDSCVQDWWELHNYNANAWALKEVPEGLGTVGSGAPRLKAAMDALYGCPPNVFPFGKQYGWSDQAKYKTYSYRIDFDDPLVQEALGVALPVSKLHKRIGPCEMTSFEILSQDRYLQATTFSDGTRVVANLSQKGAEANGCGRVPGLSWQVV